MSAVAVSIALAIIEAFIAAAPAFERIAEMASRGLRPDEIRDRLADPRIVGDDVIERLLKRRERGRALLGRAPENAAENVRSTQSLLEGAAIAAPLLERWLEWVDEGIDKNEFRRRLSDPDHLGDGLLARITTRRDRGRELLGRAPRPG